MHRPGGCREPGSGLSAFERHPADHHGLPEAAFRWVAEAAREGNRVGGHRGIGGTGVVNRLGVEARVDADIHVMDIEGHLDPAEGCEVVSMAGCDQRAVAVLPFPNHPPEERRHGLDVSGKIPAATVDSHSDRGLGSFLLHVLLLPGLGQVAVNEALEAGHRALGLEEGNGQVPPGAFPVGAVEAAQVVGPHTWHGVGILGRPLAVSQGCHLVRVGDFALAQLADVMRRGSDLSQVVFAVLGLGVVPGHLAPFELNEFTAVRAGQVIPALVAAEEALPYPAFDHSRRAGHKGLRAAEGLEALFSQVESIGLPGSGIGELVDLVGDEHPYRAAGQVGRAVTSYESKGRPGEVLLEVGYFISLGRVALQHDRAVLEHGQPAGLAE